MSICYRKSRALKRLNVKTSVRCARVLVQVLRLMVCLAVDVCLVCISNERIKFVFIKVANKNCKRPELLAVAIVSSSFVVFVVAIIIVVVVVVVAGIHRFHGGRFLFSAIEGI